MTQELLLVLPCTQLIRRTACMRVVGLFPTYQSRMIVSFSSLVNDLCRQ